MTNAEANLERPVSFRAAARKLGRIRGDEGHAGGWIYDRHGKRLAHGWDAYGQLMVRSGLICQDAEHDGGNGKWYIWAIGLNEHELRVATALFARA